MACRWRGSRAVTASVGSTLPGVQAQIDWGECGTIVEGGVSRRSYLFVFVLGFSRVTFARFTTSMRQPELLSCTREAFEAWGVPQELLVDNMKTAVDRHLVGEDVLLQVVWSPTV